MPAPTWPNLADWTARALPMTGQRWASSCSLEMAPPQGEEATAWGAGRVEEDKARKVAGEAFFRKGHMALDCRRTASMMGSSRASNVVYVVLGGWRRIGVIGSGVVVLSCLVKKEKERCLMSEGARSKLQVVFSVILLGSVK